MRTRYLASKPFFPREVSIELEGQVWCPCGNQVNSWIHLMQHAMLHRICYRLRISCSGKHLYQGELLRKGQNGHQQKWCPLLLGDRACWLPVLLARQHLQHLPTVYWLDQWRLFMYLMTNRNYINLKNVFVFFCPSSINAFIQILIKLPVVWMRAR